MNLLKLRLLHQSMIAQDLRKTKFDFRFRQLVFSVIYIAEEFPHELLFGCKAHNLFFVVKVKEGYAISTYLSEQYGSLLRALDLRPDKLNPFSPNVFFEAFDNVTPISAGSGNTPTIEDIAFHSRDVEDADKIHFFGWLNHDGKHSNPSQENLAKTKRICGLAEYELCLKHHISSRWTDVSDLAVPYCRPKNKID